MKAFPVGRLSSILQAVSTELNDEFGLTRLAIGGGSAPAILDHIYSGSALRMRDFDMVLVADRPVEEDLARRIGEALDSPALRFLPRYVYPRRRSRNENEDLWVAGWGLLWDGRGVEVDLSIFHDDDARGLNGLMNVDRILIPLKPGASLNEIAASMLMAGSAEAAMEAGLIDDPDGGYAGWLHRAPVIVAWNAIHASPIECGIRIVRTCVNKLHLSHLHAELADPLRAAIVLGYDRGDRFVRVRTIVKLFHDDRAGVELELMHGLGSFRHWLPEIGDVIERLGHGGLTALFAQADREGRKDQNHHAAFAKAGEQGGDELSALRLEALLLQMPAAKREKLLEEVAIAEPMFAALVRSQLPGVARRHPRTTAPPRRAAPPRKLARA
jgi:hypothetical protein